MSIELEKVLCHMLAHTCPSQSITDQIKEFRYDLHCHEIVIHAKCVDVILDDNNNGVDFKYEIIKYEII